MISRGCDGESGVLAATAKRRYGIFLREHLRHDQKRRIGNGAGLRLAGRDSEGIGEVAAVNRLREAQLGEGEAEW